MGAGRLQHRQVAALLFACPLGLTRWEFVQLLAAAHEQPGGWIEYGPFVAVSLQTRLERCFLIPMIFLAPGFLVQTPLESSVDKGTAAKGLQ